jgi:hypothetical protein
MRQFMKRSLFAALLFSAPGMAFAEHSRDLEREIAGTYLSTLENDALILQLGRDGNMTIIFAEQFLNLGVIGEDFSNTKGNWKRVGLRRIVAHSVDIAFEGPELVGVAAARYVIDFDRHLQNARLNCTGAIFAPGVDPFSEDAEPLPGSVFACNEYFLKRLP